jgi:glucokinase
VPLARILAQHLGVPSRLENDANCQAMAEHRFGAGRGFRDIVFVTASTGIGGGIIIDGELYVGASGGAGEVGHIPVSPNGPACGAGHPGCLEAYSSGTGIAARAQEMIRGGLLPRTARLAEQNPPLGAHTVYMAAQQGEAEAMELVQTAGRYLGMGFAALINTFNPEVLVVGGGLVNMGDDFLKPAIETAKERAFGQNWGDVRIVEGELGQRSAALGAIAVARDLVAPGAGPAGA